MHVDDLDGVSFFLRKKGSEKEMKREGSQDGILQNIIEYINTIIVRQNRDYIQLYLFLAESRKEKISTPCLVEKEELELRRIASGGQSGRKREEKTRRKQEKKQDKPKY